MRRIDHPLLALSLGCHRTLSSFHFGPSDTGPKVYIQASLHAEELPGMLVAHHLRQALERLEHDGQLTGEVVLVPVANPIGLAQRLDHKPMGRFELGSSENFNRHYPALASAVWPKLKARLTADAANNVALVRAAVGDDLRSWQPETELQSLRHTILGLSYDADRVLDLHCDCEAVLHLYSEDACWPDIEPLARYLGCQAVLLARNSGGAAFDESMSGLWWQLRDLARADGIQAPLPQACASTTVELRGELDVSHAWAQADAQAVLNYLQHQGVLRGSAPALPDLPCEATPLSGSQTVTSPLPGVVVFVAQTGDYLNPGDTVAQVIDPIAATVYLAKAEVAGIFYARVRDRYITTGGELGKIAGRIPFRQGDLLGA